VIWGGANCTSAEQNWQGEGGQGGAGRASKFRAIVYKFAAKLSNKRTVEEIQPLALLSKHGLHADFRAGVADEPTVLYIEDFCCV
jgi:hypothetical protein